MAVERAHWGSRLAFVLAAAGSAVGLGNLWKFPYITWENKGGAFVIVYLVAVLVLGLPIMVAEILVGRRAQLSPVPAFEKLGGKGWSVVGWLGVATGAIIQSYYMVIAGWSVHSFYQCIKWSIGGYQQPGKEAFGEFIGNGALQIGFTTIFTVMTAVIVYRGVSGGIEKATKIMVPALCAILLYLFVTALAMPGRDQALSLIFVPHFSQLPATGVLEAVGHSFFTLSLGLGAMITYGSYISKKESIFRAALAVVLFDTAVALVATIAMFTIIFSVPDLAKDLSGSTVGMLFITLPHLFYTVMPGGVVLAPLFYVLVGFAALTSTISLGEVVASLFIDKLGWTRPKAIVASAAGVFVGSLLAALSLGAVGPLSSFELFDHKEGVLSTLDHLASNWLLPLGGLGTTLFVGWFLGRKSCQEELGITQPNIAFTVWIWILRVVAPIAILAIIIAVILGKDFS